MEQPLVDLGLPLGSPGFGCTDDVTNLWQTTPAPLVTGDSTMSSWVLFGSPKAITG